MADIPENKQKRLMSLNQDVLAVSPGQAPAREREAPRAAASGAGHSQATDTQARTVSPLLLMLLLVVALSGVVAGVVGMLMAHDSRQQLAAMSAQIGQPDTQVSALESRVAEMEARLEAAGQETDKMDGQAQSSLLQVNTRIRKVGADVTRLANDLAQLQQKLATSSNSAARAETLVNQQASKLAALEKQLASLKTTATQAPAPAPAPAASKPLTGAEWEQQLVQLNIKVERQASEIRTIYRMLEAQ